jgi:hypothetical protein
MHSVAFGNISIFHRTPRPIITLQKASAIRGSSLLEIQDRCYQVRTNLLLIEWLRQDDNLRKVSSGAEKPTRVAVWGAGNGNSVLWWQPGNANATFRFRELCLISSIYDY